MLAHVEQVLQLLVRYYCSPKICPKLPKFELLSLVLLPSVESAHFKTLRSSVHWTISESMLNQAFAQKARSVLHNTYEQSSIYRGLLAGRQTTPAQIKSIEDTGRGILVVCTSLIVAKILLAFHGLRLVKHRLCTQMTLSKLICFTGHFDFTQL